MVQENIVLAHRGQHLRCGGGFHLIELSRGAGYELRLLEVIAIEADDCPETSQIEGTGNAEDLVLVDIELADEQFENMR